MTNCCVHSGSAAVSLTYGKQAFDSSATPVSSDQVAAAPILMFKAPPGTVFLADVKISIPVDESVLELLYGSDARRDSLGGASHRKLLVITTEQKLMQHWFNAATKVCMHVYILCNVSRSAS
jgi:hypothetical protein